MKCLFCGEEGIRICVVCSKEIEEARKYMNKEQDIEMELWHG